MNHCKHWSKPKLKLYIMSKIKYQLHKGIYKCVQCNCEYKEKKSSLLTFASTIVLTIILLDQLVKNFIPSLLLKLFIVLLLATILYIPLEVLHYFYVKFEKKY